MEEEFVANQERLKPQEERNQADRDKARRRRLVAQYGMLEFTFTRIICLTAAMASMRRRWAAC